MDTNFYGMPNRNRPVVTVSTDDYPLPSMNKDGQWVVSASAVNQEPNKVVLYDELFRTYTPITPFTTSIDYFNEVKGYEQRLANQTKGWANPADDKQINSLADVWATGGNKLKALWEFERDYVLEPIFRKEKFTKKVSHLLNNTLVNLNETLDLVTGANSVKGLMQEGFEGLKKANNADGTGRKQYNWNLPGPKVKISLGAGLEGYADFGALASTALEIATDPTNWISFGSAAVTKSVGKKALPKLITNSLDEAGLAVSREVIDDFTEVAMRTYVYKDINQSEFFDSLGRVLNSAVTKDGTALTKTHIDTFANALKTNAAVAKEFKVMNTLRSVRSQLDASQRMTLKVVGWSSSLGLGYHGIKAVAKLGKGTWSHMNATYNRIFKESGLQDATLMNYPERIADAEFKLTTFAQVNKLSKEFPVSVTKQVTREFQETQYMKMKGMLTDSKMSVPEIVKTFDNYAHEQGYVNGFDMFEKLQSVASAVPDELRKQVQELANDYQIKYDSIVYDSVVETIDTLHLERDFLDKDDIVDMSRIVKELKNTGIVEHVVSPEVYAELDKAINDLNHVINIRELKKSVDTYNSMDFKVMKQPVVFNIGTVVDKKYNVMQPKTVHELIRGGRKDELFPTLSPEREATFIKELEHMELFFSQNKFKEFYQQIAVIKEALAHWADATLTVEEAVNANIALTSIHKRFNQLQNVVEAEASKGYGNDKLDAAEQAINTYKDILNNFVTDYETKYYSKQDEANIYSDALLDKAAMRAGAHTVIDSINTLAEYKGLSEADKSELTMNLRNMSGSEQIGFPVYRNQVLVSGDERVIEAYNMLNRLIEFTDEMHTNDYFIRESGLEQLAYDMSVLQGINLNLASEMLDRLDAAIKHASEIGSNNLKDMLTQFYDMVADLERELRSMATERIKLTSKALSSKAYTGMLSKAQSVGMLLDLARVRDLFEDIRVGFGIGEIFKALADPTGQAPNAMAVSHLQGLAKSMYLYNRVVAEINKSKTIPKDLKQGVVDALAGMAMYRDTKIENVDYFTARLMDKAKEYIDGVHNAHLPRLHDITKDGDPVKTAKLLHKYLFGAQPIDGVNAERSKQMSQHWSSTTDELAKTFSTSYNVVYAGSQTGYQTGTLFEIVFVRPDGSFIKFVDAEARDNFRKTIDEFAARKVYGKSKKKVLEDLNKRADDDTAQFTVVCPSTREFAQELYDEFSNMKRTAYKQGVTLRFVGFNNALDSLGTDKILAKFLDRNKLNVHLVYNNIDYKSLMTVRSFDVAQWLRIQYEGAFQLTDSMFYSVRNIVQNMKNYADLANANTEYGAATLVPDFNKDTLRSLREVSAALTNAIEFYNSSSINRVRYVAEELSVDEVVHMQMYDAGSRIQDEEDITPAQRRMLPVAGNTVLKELSEEQYAALIASHSIEEIENYRDTFQAMLNDLGERMSLIKNTNSELGQWLLINNAIGDKLGRYNIMQVLPVGSTGVSPYSVNKVYDPALFNEWFDINAIKVKYNDELEATMLFNLNSIAEQLQNKKAGITHAELILDIPKTTLDAMLPIAMDAFIKARGWKYSVWANEVKLLNQDTNQVNKYLILELVWDSFKKVSTVPEINEIGERLRTAHGGYSDMMFTYLQFPEQFVRYDEALYLPEIPVLNSELLAESNYVMQLVKETDKIIQANADKHEFNELLRLDLEIKEKSGFTLPSMAIKREGIELYGAMINRAKLLVDAPKQWYFKQNAYNKDQAIELTKLYTDRIKEVLAHFETIGDMHAIHRNNIIMTMDAESYVMYLYKHQGFQIFDMNSEEIQNNVERLKKFMNLLKQSEQYGVRYHEDKSNNWLIVLLDKDKAKLPMKYIEQLDSKKFDELTDKDATILEWFDATKDLFSLKPAKIEFSEAQSELFYHHYKEYMNYMDEVFQGEYSLSTHRSMNRDKYKEIIAVLPDEVKDRIIPIEHLNKYDMIEGFMHNLVGDYGFGVGNIVSTHSANLITNLAAGFNVAINRLQGKDMYASSLFNKQNLLSTWVRTSKEGLGIPHYVVAEAVRKQSYVVCRLDNARVVKVDISTDKKFIEALTTGAVLLPYQNYVRAVEVINDNRVKAKWFKWLNKNYLSALKFGQLQNWGTLIRNTIDSPIKGFLQTGDFEYLTKFSETRRLVDKYEETLSTIFKVMDGSLSDKSVREFYAVHAKDVPMDEELFRAMNTFDNSTSASPTAVQLALSDNLVDQLFRFVSSNPRIKREDVAHAISIFKTTDTYEAALNSLKESKFSQDIIDNLMMLRSKVPKKELDSWFSRLIEKFPPTRKLLNINNNFERLIRMHTFLYHYKYTLGSISKGMEMTDKSQFNRARDPKAMRIMEAILPFSSFQFDNFVFWTDTAKYGSNNLIALGEDILSGVWDEEEIDTEELSRNMSIQYMFMSGNLLLNENTGLTFKLNDSLHNVFQIMAAPVQSFVEAFNVPTEEAVRLIQAINADEDAYDADPYNNIKPISRWTMMDFSDSTLSLIPMIGALWIRWHNAFEKTVLSPFEFKTEDMLLPMLMPALFGITKNDGSIPIGYNWYEQDEEYRKTHRYVYGVSYVPKWMRYDPQTYANTYQRLLGMGYNHEQVDYMLNNGWYMKAPDYQLKRYMPNRGMRKQYVRKSYAKKTYIKRPRNTLRSSRPSKPRKIRSARLNRPYTIYPDRVRMSYPVRRVYRPTLYSDRYTRTGVERETLIKWRGANKSSRQLIRDRSAASRRRTQRIFRQVRPLR